MVRYRYLLTGD